MAKPPVAPRPAVKATARPAAKPTKSPSNAELTKRVQHADALVGDAQAKANLLRAQIEVKGKTVAYDYRGGIPVVKVVDRPTK